MLSSKIGHALDPYIIWVYRLFLKKKDLNPNLITLFGFFFGILSSVFIVLGELFIAGILLLISGFFDLLDGALARTSRRVTVFGGFLDSVLDRYTDLLVLVGLGVHFVLTKEMIGVIMVLISIVGVAIIPYAKARALAEGINCNAGLLERPERAILLILGLILDYTLYSVAILAFLSHVTVLQRIMYVKRSSELARIPE